jgi:hypothetical protein
MAATLQVGVPQLYVCYPLSLRMKPQWTSDDCPERRSAQYQLIALVTHHGRNR